MLLLRADLNGAFRATPRFDKPRKGSLLKLPPAYEEESNLLRVGPNPAGTG